MGVGAHRGGEVLLTIINLAVGYRPTTDYHHCAFVMAEGTNGADFWVRALLLYV